MTIQELANGLRREQYMLKIEDTDKYEALSEVIAEYMDGIHIECTTRAINTFYEYSMESLEEGFDKIFVDDCSLNARRSGASTNGYRVVRIDEIEEIQQTGLENFDSFIGLEVNE